MDTAANESRMHMMVELLKVKVGFADIEEFSLGLNYKCRAKSESDNGGQIEWKVIRTAMESKLIDARKIDKSLKREQNIIRKKIYGKNGDASRKAKKTIRILKSEARNKKKELRIKYSKKIEHLLKKYRQDDEDKLDAILKGMENLEDLSIFDRDKFNAIMNKDYEVTVVGDVDLTENERKVLRLHPKFSVIQDLPEDALDLDGELSYAKLRMQISKENDEKVDGEEDLEITDEEREKLEEMEAQCRQIFNLVEKSYDDRKRRGTDLKECSKVSLGKP